MGPSHSDKVIRRLERDIFPWLGARPIATITAHELLIAVRRIEERGANETARRALLNCSQVFRFNKLNNIEKLDLLKKMSINA